MTAIESLTNFLINRKIVRDKTGLTVDFLLNGRLQSFASNISNNSPTNLTAALNCGEYGSLKCAATPLTDSLITRLSADIHFVNFYTVPLSFGSAASGAIANRIRFIMNRADL